MPRFESKTLEANFGKTQVFMDVFYTVRQNDFTINRVDVDMVIGPNGRLKEATADIKEACWTIAEKEVQKILDADPDGYLDVYELFEEEDDEDETPETHQS